MSRLFLTLLLVSMVNLYAQTSQITVLEQGNSLPMIQAHISVYQRGAIHHTELSDAKGNVQTTSFGNQWDSLRITYLGFDPITVIPPLSKDTTIFLTPRNSLLDEVVVTAQYRPESTDKAVHKIKVIDRKKIDQMAAISLEEVLTNETNIRLNQDAILGTQITMQGMSGENVKIMIDGVPVIGRTDGNIDLSQILLDNVERIEVIEGPLSVNYGTNALAGTINIITKSGQNASSSLQANTYLESIGTYNFSGAWRHQMNKWHVGLSGARNVFNGWSPGDDPEPNGEDLIADESRVDQWDPKEIWSATANVGYRNKRTTTGYTASFFREKITNRGAPRLPFGETAFDDYYYTTRFDQSIQFQHEFKNTYRLQSVAGWNFYERQKETMQTDLTTLDQQRVADASAYDTSVFIQYMNRTNLIIPLTEESWMLEVGYDLNHEVGEGKRIESKRQEIGDYALFATTEYRWAGFIFRPGVRYSYNTQYNAPLTPSINVKWGKNKWTLRAAYARGFRAPSLKELYLDFVDINHNLNGNSDLEAEQSHNFTASAQWKRLKNQTLWQVEWSGFYNEFYNEIRLLEVDANDALFSYANVGESYSMGAQISTSVVWNHLRTEVAFLYTGIGSKFDNQDDIQYDYYPELTFNARYDFKELKASVGAFYKYNGEVPRTSQDSEGGLVTRYTDPYNTLDLSLTKRFWNEQIHATFGAKNVFDVTSVDSEVRSGGAHQSSGSLLIGTGRSYFVKLTWKWNYGAN